MWQSCQVLKRRIVGTLADRAKGRDFEYSLCGPAGRCGLHGILFLPIRVPIHKRVYSNSLLRRTQAPCTNALPTTLTPFKADVRNNELKIGRASCRKECKSRRLQ